LERQGSAGKRLSTARPQPIQLVIPNRSRTQRAESEAFGSNGSLNIGILHARRAHTDKLDTRDKKENIYGSLPEDWGLKF
jgi:hypothetical protein